MTFDELRLTVPLLLQIEQQVLSQNRRAAEEELYWFDEWKGIRLRLVEAFGDLTQESTASSRRMHCALMHLSNLANNMV